MCNWCIDSTGATISTATVVATPIITPTATTGCGDIQQGISREQCKCGDKNLEQILGIILLFILSDSFKLIHQFTAF